MLEFYTDEYPKARKPHTCEFCGRTIERGERYAKQTGKCDGEFFSRSLCQTCDKILNAFFLDADDDYFTWDEVHEWLYEAHCEQCGQHDRCQLRRGDPSCGIIRKNYG